jgi:hypothetical protein
MKKMSFLKGLILSGMVLTMAHPLMAKSHVPQKVCCDFSNTQVNILPYVERCGTVVPCVEPQYTVIQDLEVKNKSSSFSSKVAKVMKSLFRASATVASGAGHLIVLKYATELLFGDRNFRHLGQFTFGALSLTSFFYTCYRIWK